VNEMRGRTLGKSEIQVRRLDHVKLEHIFWEELIADGWDGHEDAVGCKITWAPIHVYEFEDNTVWLLNNEGIGYSIDSDTSHQIQVGLRYGNKMTLGGPSWLFNLSLDTIRLCLTDEYVDIESDTVVRQFGNRLEQNLTNNINSIKQRIHEIEVGTKEITFTCKAEVTITYTGRVPADLDIPDRVDRWSIDRDYYDEEDRKEQQKLRYSMLDAWDKAMHNGSLERQGEPYQHERSVPLDYRVSVKDDSPQINEGEE
jgi:hypothetical protein